MDALSVNSFIPTLDQIDSWSEILTLLPILIIFFGLLFLITPFRPWPTIIISSFGFFLLLMEVLLLYGSLSVLLEYNCKVL